MNIQNLENICYESIINNILKMPPYLKEKLIGKSLDKITEQNKKESIVEQTKNINDILPVIVPEIMEDLISSLTENNRFKTNFYKKYPDINKNIIETAVRIAENSVRQMEERYVHAAFTLKNNNYNEREDYESYDYDQDYYKPSYIFYD
jgi:hypothetical protein